MSDYNRLKEKISKAKHQRKSDAENAVAFYDREGHWLFEVYWPKGREGAMTRGEGN